MVELTADEWRAVDTPIFQRLRGIRQLALTHLVYPGAHHTRFEHSIGVLNVTTRLAEKLKIKRDDRTVLRAAGLFHDIGHGVFSHVSEQVIEDLRGVKVHELMSAYVLRHDQDLRGALGDEVCERAAQLITRRGGMSLGHDIVSGPADADKLDYLLRDSYFCGVSYGRYDLPRLIDSARVVSPRSADPRLGFDADSVWAVEEMLIARHHMHRQVYGHKTRLATDIMLNRALKLAVHERVVDPRGFLVALEDGTATITPEFAEPYLKNTDRSVMQELEQARGRGDALGDLAEGLLGRDLLRRSAEIRIDERQRKLGATRFANLRDPEAFRGMVVGMERRIAAELGLPAHLIAVIIHRLTDPTYRDPGEDDSQQILFVRGRGQPRRLDEESEIFRDVADPRPHDEHVWVFLYTPRLRDEQRRRARSLLWNELKTAG